MALLEPTRYFLANPIERLLLVRRASTAVRFIDKRHDPPAKKVGNTRKIERGGRTRICGAPMQQLFLCLSFGFWQKRALVKIISNGKTVAELLQNGPPLIYRTEDVLSDSRRSNQGRLLRRTDAQRRAQLQVSGQGNNLEEAGPSFGVPETWAGKPFAFQALEKIPGHQKNRVELGLSGAWICE